MPLRQHFTGPTTSLDDQMESYAVERVPAGQRWPALAILLVLTGNITAMFWFSLGSQFAYLVGWPGMLIPLAYMIVAATILGSLIMKISSKEGLSMVLLSRGLGFGAKGSAGASFVYGINYIFYFLFEGSIVSHALSEYFGLGLNSLASTLVFAVVGTLALVFAWRGMHSMTWLQRYGTPIFLVLFVVGMVMLASGHDIVGPAGWSPTGNQTGDTMWQAFSLANGQIVFQALMATDYGRFSRRSIGYRGTGGIMLSELVMILGVMLTGAMISFTMLPELQKTDPTHAATLAIDPGFLFASFMGLVGVVFTIVTQIRINMMNLYSGSLAFSNTWDALFPTKVRRNRWMLGLLILGVALYPVNILKYTDTFLAITGIMTNSWIFILLADYYICRKMMGWGPWEEIEYREGIVRDWNPAGVAAMIIAIVAGGVGIFGGYPQYYASVVAMIVAPVIYLGLSALGRGKWYVNTDAEKRAVAVEEPVS